MMKNLVFVLYAVCLLVVVSKAQFASVDFPRSLPVFPVGIESDWFVVTLSEPPLAAFTVNLKTDSSNIVLTPSTLHFDPLTQSATFRWNTNAVGFYEVTPVLDSTGSEQYLSPSIFTIYSKNRSITLDVKFPPSANVYDLYVESTSEPIQLLLSNPSTSDLTITPSSQYGVIQFTPSSITIPAGSVAGHFTVYATFNLDSGNYTLVSWDTSGSQSYWYNKPDSFYISVNTKGIHLPDLSYSTVVGFNSTTLYAYADDFPASSITVTPSAPETVFNPSTFQFSPEVRVVPFTLVTTTPVDNAAKTVYYYASGSDKPNYNLPLTGTLNVDRRRIVVQAPSVYVYNRQTLLSVRVGAPLTQPVTIQFFAANSVFSPSNVTLSGTTLSQTVTITPSIVGPDTISFLVTGVEQDYYFPIDKIDAPVVRGNFISPTNWYIPSLFVGVESPRIPVRVNVPPTKNVTLTLVSADVVFTPATLTFTSSNLQQYFTATPYFTNAGIDGESVSTRNAVFIVGGNDFASFDVPTGVSIVVSRREVLIKWSNQVYDNPTKNLYLKKQYIAWATISHPPATGVTLTPTNPFLSFSPSVLNFGPGQTHISFVVTVEAVAGTTPIDYIIGGPDAGWYQTPSSENVVTALRPLGIYQAVLSPDTRSEYGALYTNPTATSLQQNHVFSFSLSTIAAPENLVITPKSRHINFNPSSIKLSSFVDNYVVKKTVDTQYPINYNINNPFVAANFTCDPLTSGLLEVWVELSGNDADYYDIPNNFKLNFNRVSYTQSDQPSRQVSSSSKLNFVGGSFLAVLFFFVVMIVV